MGEEEPRMRFHSMKESCVDTGQCLLKQGVAGSSLEGKTTQQVGIEVHKGDEVTIAEPRVELESEKNKESGPRTIAPQDQTIAISQSARTPWTSSDPLNSTPNWSTFGMIGQPNASIHIDKYYTFVERV